MFYSLQQAADVVGVNKSTVLAPSKRARFPPPATSAINGSSSQPSCVGFIHRPLRATAKSNASNTHRSERAEANRHAALWSELKISLLRYALALLSPKKYGCTTTMLSARGVKI